jgi:hypothetical protein
MLPAHHDADSGGHCGVLGQVNQGRDELRIPVAGDLNENTALITHAESVLLDPLFNLRRSTHNAQAHDDLGIVRELGGNHCLTFILAGNSTSDRGTL